MTNGRAADGDGFSGIAGWGFEVGKKNGSNQSADQGSFVGAKLAFASKEHGPNNAAAHVITLQRFQALLEVLSGGSFVVIQIGASGVSFNRLGCCFAALLALKNDEVQAVPEFFDGQMLAQFSSEAFDLGQFHVFDGFEKVRSLFFEFLSLQGIQRPFRGFGSFRCLGPMLLPPSRIGAFGNPVAPRHLRGFCGGL
ncbi:MAG: hypothetical protein IAE77_10100 [Prosthecobacter sp.]|nr:hypothetical protein [Prosthecobacter sp.]